jgi:hypothetical protein
MTLLPEIRGQLLHAAFGADDPSARAPRHGAAGRLAIAGSIVVSVAVASVFLLSLHRMPTPSSPPTAGPPGRPPVAWVDALRRARESTLRRDPGCRLPQHDRVRGQRFLTTAPPKSLTSILPSLASPARGALRVTIRELRALDVDANGIYVRYAWQAHTDRIHYYVVPAAVVGATKTVPVRCYREELAAFGTQARRFPVGQRVEAIAYAQRLLSSFAVGGVALVTVGWGGHGATYYQAWMLARLRTLPDFGSGSRGNNQSTTTALLITGPVATVTATYPAQSYPGRVPRTFSVTKRPVRNLVIFHLAGAWDPPRLTFRSSSGAVIGPAKNP